MAVPACTTSPGSAARVSTVPENGARTVRSARSASACARLAWACAVSAFVAVSSVYLAWHYAIDGYVSAAVTLVVYAVARKMIPADPRPAPDMQTATVNRPEAVVTAS